MSQYKDDELEQKYWEAQDQIARYDDESRGKRTSWGTVLSRMFWIGALIAIGTFLILAGMVWPQLTKMM